MAKKRSVTKRRTVRRSTRAGAIVTVKPLDRVREHAFSLLSLRQRTRTNLYADERVYDSGETIGPRRQQITTKRPSLLVFADDDPMANFAHPCRYLLYDAQSGELDRIVPAVFPPFVKAPPKTLKPF